MTAFDASPVMAGLARQQTAGRVRIDQAVLGDPLPYPDNAFDLVVCALAIHYARDRAAAFAEFFRVLRPGGAAVVSTQHPVTDWLRKGGSYFQATLETDIWHTPSGDHPVHFWREPLSALCTAATDAGFLIERVIEPVPAETMRERYPEDYEKLNREPGFLILRFLKPVRPSRALRADSESLPSPSYAARPNARSCRESGDDGDQLSLIIQARMSSSRRFVSWPSRRTAGSW